MMTRSGDSDDEMESAESTDGADPGEAMPTHITTPLPPFPSLSDTAVSACRHAAVLLRAAVCECRGPIIRCRIPHPCACDSDTRVRVQGAEADATVPPSAETSSQPAKPDKTVPLPDAPGRPSRKAPRTRRASSPPAQRRTPKPFDSVSACAQGRRQRRRRRRGGR